MNTFSLKDLQLGNPAELTQGIISSIAEFIGQKLFYNAIGRKRRLLSYLGMLNNLIFCYASDRGLLKRTGNNKGEYRYEIDVSRLGELTALGSISVALSGTSEYMKEWWGFKVFRSLDSIREMRTQLSELGLFTFAVPRFKIQKKGEPSVAESATYDNFDIVKALLTYQAIESIAVDGTVMTPGFGWDALPEHKGAMMKRLYDLVFKSGLGMRRSPSPDAGTGDEATEEESAIERQCMAKNSKDRDRHELESLKDSLQQLLAQGLDDIWAYTSDRVAYLERKLFGANWVPIDADIPF